MMDSLTWDGLDVHFKGMKYRNPNNWQDFEWDNMSDETAFYFGDLNNDDQDLGGFDNWSSEWSSYF